MKKYTRKSTKTIKRASRSKKITRRRRQRGGGTVMINCTLNPSTGAITANSSDASISVAPSTNTLVITSQAAIKNIQFGRATAAKVGTGAGILLLDQGDSKFVVPASSFMHTRTLTAAQKKLNTAVGMAFTKGVKVTNLNASNLGISGTAVAPFVITVTT